MNPPRRLVLLFALSVRAVAACGGSPAGVSEPAASRGSVSDTDVRVLLANAARDVTRDGPTAWRTYFDDGPAFFMAVNGRLVFADGRAMAAALPAIAREIARMDLTWGPDLRVDMLSDDLAVVAVSYREVRTSASGERVEERGFFTATAERKRARWRFRNVHWSVPTAG